MRLAPVNCILLACIATTIATEPVRPKRDLQFWKDIITSKLGLGPLKPVQKEENVKILRMPGFEQVLVRAVPKVNVVAAPAPERIVQVDPSMAVLASYLGTKTPEETLLALQGVKSLLQSGVLNARQDLMEIAPQRSPMYVLPPPVVQKKLDCPKPRPVVPMPAPVYGPMPAPVYGPMPALRPLSVMPPVPVWSPPSPPVLPAPVFPVVPRVVLPEIRRMPPPMVRVPAPPMMSVSGPPLMPVPAPPLMPVPVPPMMTVSVPPMRPVPVPPMIPVPVPPRMPVPVFPANYSYKQVKSDGSVTSYFSKGNQDVIMTEISSPPPPPPSYIIDRFQKIIYGMPLGVETAPRAPEPMFIRQPFTEVMIPVPTPKHFPQPVPQIMTEPADVFVKVKQPSNHFHRGSIIAGEKVSKKPIASTLVEEGTFMPQPLTVDIPGSPLVVPPPPVIVKTFESESSHSTGTSPMREPDFEHMSKLPPPPPELLEKIEDETTKAHKHKSMWGYSMKVANGVGSWQNMNGEKIYYSHLESPQKSDETVLPYPLSSRFDEPKNIKGFMNEGVKEDDVIGNSEKDEFGHPFASSKLHEEGSTGSNTHVSDLQPMKKFPPLPMPIAGENEKITWNSVVDAANFLSTGANYIKNNQPGSGRFLYSQVNHDGTVKTYLGNGQVNGPAIVAESLKNAPGRFTGIFDDTKPLLQRAPIVVDKHSPGFSYTQYDNTGGVTITTGDRQMKNPEVMVESVKIPAGPAGIVTQPSGFSYTQINGDKVTSFTGDDRVRKPVIIQEMERVPLRPGTIMDVIGPLPKRPVPMPVRSGAIMDVIGPLPKRPVPMPVRPGAIMDVIGPLPKLPVPMPVRPGAIMNVIGPLPKRPVPMPVQPGAIMDVIEALPKRPVPLPVRPGGIIDVIEPLPKPPSAVVRVAEKNPTGAIMFEKPVVSRYVYKQISHSNPQPFTVVKVEDIPRIEVPRGDVHVKVNRHEHFRPDGTKYPCTEVHMVPALPSFPGTIPDAPIPAAPVGEVAATVPSGFMYVPPLTADVPSLPIHKVEVDKTASNFSYTQVTSGTSTEGTTTENTTSTADEEASDGKEASATSEEPLSLSLNPIVVASEDSKYTYTQTNSDGSSINVQGNKDNTVSVNVKDGETKSESLRGDIPDALA